MYGSGGNPNLKPEESISYEVGIDQKLNYNISTGLSAYYTKIDNLIESRCIAVCNGDWINTFPVYQNINIDKASMRGGEVYANWVEMTYLLNHLITMLKLSTMKQIKNYQDVLVKALL